MGESLRIEALRPTSRTAAGRGAIAIIVDTQSSYSSSIVASCQKIVQAMEVEDASQIELIFVLIRKVCFYVVSLVRQSDLVVAKASTIPHLIL